MIINGREIADEILQGLHGPLTLGVVMGADSASDSFVKMKERIAQSVGVRMIRFSPEQMDEALLCDGVIVQLPLEGSEALIKRIPPHKDVDALGEAPLVLPPVAEAIAEILMRYDIAVAGKKAVVVGAGALVGVPALKLLTKAGAHVSVVTLEQGSLSELRDADIVVLGAGKPRLITPPMLKAGVVLFDAGSSELGGKPLGDADPACANMASVFTPVPGGIGPIAVAMIFKNLFELAQKHV